MRPLYLPGEEAAQRQKAASQSGAVQPPGRLQQQDRAQRQLLDGSAAAPRELQFPADGALVRSGGGAAAAYAPAQTAWVDPRRSSGNAVPSMEAAATVAAEVLSSSRTGEIMVAADFTDGGVAHSPKCHP